MFTRCPNCDTHFEITQEYLDAAHGKVRCGQCDHIFNALDNLYERDESKTGAENTSDPELENNNEVNTETTEADDTVNKDESSLIEQDEIEIIDEDETTDEGKIEITDEDENDFEIIDYNEEASDQAQSYPLIDTTTNTTSAEDMDVLNSLMEAPAQEKRNAFQEEKTIEAGADLKLLEDLRKDIPDNSNSSLDDELSSLNKNLDDELSSLDDDLDDELSRLDDDLDDELSSLDDELDELDSEDLLAELDQIESDFRNKEKRNVEKDSEQSSEVMPDNTSAIPDDSTQSANNYTAEEEVVPSFLTQQDTPQSHPTAVFGWLAATIVFLFILAGQYLYFNSKNFAQNPEMHTLLKPFCQLTGCTLPLIKTPRKIVTVTHDVRTFGTIKNALEIQLTFKNKASYTQSYPLLEITFLNPVGNIVARRKFSPAEYMSSTDNYNQGIKSNQSQDINLKIVDPDPTSLLSFEFNYL